MLIDDLTIRVRSGKGGDGIVAWSGNKMSLGPTGGSGGNGGSIYFEGVSDLGALNRLRHRKVFEAEDGQNGKRQLNDGNRGEDLIVSVPVGTVIHNLTTKSDQEIVATGERLLAAAGGHGRAARNRANAGTRERTRRVRMGSYEARPSTAIDVKHAAGHVGGPG